MMKRNYYKVIVTIGMMLCLSLSACSKREKDGTKNEENIITQIPQTEDITEQTEEPVPTEEAVEETELAFGKEYVEELTYSDYDRFTGFKEAMIPCEFTSTESSDNWEEPYDITGSYDLNQDGTEDKINVHFDPVTYEAILTINDSKYEFSTAYPSEGYIFDLDVRDSSVEFVLYDAGMSADPSYTFYRYDGKEILNLGTIGSWFECTLCFDGYGRAIVADSFLNQIDPKIIRGYYDSIDGEFKYEEFDLSDVANQEYSIPETIEGAYFEETDKTGEDFTPDWTEEERTNNELVLNAGDKITIKGIYEFENYQVELSDGRVGMLYFWIGD